MRSAPLSSSPDDPVDQFNLGVSYSNGGAGCKDPKEAFYWYRQSAKQGYAPAQFNLALSYANAEGVGIDEELSAHWYRKAAEQGYASAQCNLGICYFYGTGVSRDLSHAVFWLLSAATQGEPNAQYNLGHVYSAGQGVPANREIAAAWYQRASEQQHDLAKEKFRRMHLSGIKPAALVRFEGVSHEDFQSDKKRKQAIRKVSPSIESSQVQSSSTVAISVCKVCKVEIATRVLKAHMREYHRPEPKIAPHAPRSPRTKKPSGPILPVSSTPAYRSAKAALESLCPRCGGDGGVRGGCTKCDGTGWVSLAMEHDVVYRPDKGIGENSRVSNSDYLGGNGGAHFREIDGRIGTIPSYDDYSEES